MCDKAKHCFYWTSCSAETTVTVVHVRLETKNTGPYLWFLFLHLQHSWTSVTPSWLRHTPACLNLRRPSRSLCALIRDKILLPDELGAVPVTLVTADRARVNSQCAPVDAASCRVHTQAVQQLGHHLKAGSWSICKFHFFRFHDKLVHHDETTSQSWKCAFKNSTGFYLKLKCPRSATHACWDIMIWRDMLRWDPQGRSASTVTHHLNAPQQCEMFTGIQWIYLFLLIFKKKGTWWGSAAIFLLNLWNTLLSSVSCRAISSRSVSARAETRT